MRRISSPSSIWGLLIAATFVVSGSRLYAEDTLPARIDDRVFWQLIGALSEPDGDFQSENLLSNETEFPRIMAAVQRTVRPNGAYLGVGPEQNFNYIAVTHPKIAFLIDIRRQNMLEHLLYKAIFELSPDRAAFISHLFSRKQPQGLTGNLSAAELFDAYSGVPGDDETFKKGFAEIERLLIETHRFDLTTEDRNVLERIYGAFFKYGPLIDYNSQGGGPSGGFFRPSYAQLMTEPDNAGKEWSYLASESNYGVVRNLETRNLIIPITGDFGGPKAIRAVGSYLADHGAVVSAFYTSNVEGYLFQGGDRMGNANGGSARFYENAAKLPLDNDSTFIRWIPRGSIVLEPIQTTIDNFRSGRLSALDFFQRGRIGGFGNISSPGRGSNYPPLVFDWTVYAGILFHLLAALAAFAIRFVGGALWSRLASRDRILSCFAWAVCGYALAGIVESSLSGAGWLRLPLYLNKSLLIVYGLFITAGFAAVFVIATWFVFRKLQGSDYQRRMMRGAALPLILLPVFGIHVAGDINRGLDIRQPMIMRMSVLRRSADSMRYYIDIEGAATAGFLPSKIEVSRRIHDSMIEGDTIPIVLGQGTLGIPWYRSINGFSMSE